MHKTLTLAALLLVSSFAFAQAGNGTIRGVVRDQSRNVIPGVTVTLINLDTLAMRRTVTNEKGEYQFQVAPGVYQATAALRGFESAKTAKVLLEENQTLRMETTLSVSPPGQWIPLERQ